MYSFRIFVIIAILGALIVGCGDDDDYGNASLNIHLMLAPGATQQVEITRVVVTISGTDIDTQEVELKVEGRKATGVVAVPAGEEKQITVKAYAGNNVAFEGEAYVDHPKPGQQIELQIQLRPTSLQEGEKIFENGNIGAVDNQPTSPTVFRLDKSYMITMITTYHWNYAQGSTLGTTSLKDSNGKVYGPWKAYGTDGQGGVKNAYWNVAPYVVLPAGTYTIIDSDPATWSQNIESNGAGFAIVVGYPADEGTSRDTGDVIKGKDGVEMVLIPAGEFQMGSIDNESDDKPVHTVYLDDFYIDKYKVTNAQYRKFIQATGRKDPEGLTFKENNSIVDFVQPGFKPWNDPNYNQDDQPVVCISWEDATAYAEWVGERLPTEAEWEKAARGGLIGKKYTWDDDWPPPKMSANIADETYGRKYPNWDFVNGYNDNFIYVSPVGRFAPNGYGLFDMIGNVCELCADWYSETYYFESPKQNPKGPASGEFRVIRGSAWVSSGLSDIEVSTRLYFDPPDPISILGFRCVKSKTGK